MALFESYNTVWVFSHPDAEDDMTTGLDYRMVGQGTALDEDQYMADLNDAIIADLQTDYLTLISTQFNLERIVTFNQDAPQFGLVTEVDSPGIVLDNSVSLRSAPVITKNTALRGRSFRGRMYLMAPPEVSQDNGVLQQTYIDDLATLVGKLQSVSGPTFGASFNSTVYSTKLAGDQPITSFTVRSKLGSIRKRQGVN